VGTLACHHSRSVINTVAVRGTISGSSRRGSARSLVSGTAADARARSGAGREARFLHAAGS
jgi:hypothetical protein